MKATERGIPLINSLMVSAIREMVTTGKPLSGKVFSDSQNLTYGHAVKLLHLLDQTRITTPTVEKGIHELNNVAVMEKVLSMLDSLNSYGLQPYENTALNLIDRFITTWSSEKNEPVIVNGETWKTFSGGARGVYRRTHEDDFLVKHDRGLYSVRADLMKKYLVWKQIAKLLSDEVGMVKVAFSSKSVTSKLNLTVAFVNLTEYYILRGFCKFINPISSTELIHKLQEGAIEGLHPELSEGLLITTRDHLFRLGLLKKHKGGYGKTLFSIKDKEKTAKALDLIDNIDGFGLERVHNTLMRNLLTVMEFQEQSTLTDGQKAIFNKMNINIRTSSKSTGEVFVTRVPHGQGKRVKLIPAPHVATAIDVWLKVSQLLREISAS